jgi:signal transduction histidine kinase/ligand-binding sensor domain-containing protein/DNA-binding response OmpR family regulator
LWFKNLKMKIYFYDIFIFFLSILIYLPGVSFAQEYHFKHLTSEDGLSSNIVHCINKDSRGYLWIGCNNALNRYNGSSFTKFRYNPKDSTSITSGQIASITEDSNGMLWIATKNGISIFDYKKENFKRVFSVELKKTSISKLYITKKNDFFIVTSQGLYILNKKSNKFEKFFQNSVDDASSTMVGDNLGNILIGTWGNGIIYWDVTDGNCITAELAAKTTLNEENKVECLAIDEMETFWIGTLRGLYSGTLKKVNREIKLEINPVKDRNGKFIVANNKIHCLIFDENENLWIGTENGLNIFDPRTKTLQRLSSKKGLTEGLNNNLINCLFYYSNEGMWVGTYQGGVNFYSKGNTPFRDRIPFITQSENKKIQYVKSIYQGPDEKLWLGTDFGLYRFSKDFKLEKTYTHSSNPGSLSVGGVTAIYSDKENNFWIGTWGGGVDRFDPRQEIFIEYSDHVGRNFTDSTISGDTNIRAFVEDSKGYLWVINMFGIVDRYNKKTRSFKHFNLADEVNRPNIEIKSVAIDSKDNIWIGSTGAGLIKLDTKTFKPELFALTEDNDSRNIGNVLGVDVFSVYIDKLERIWLGTDRGICLFNPGLKSFTDYSTNRGLNSEMVLGIVTDKNEDVWVSTLKGISKLDVKSGYFSNFDVADGAISNAEVAYKSKNGMLFFAGVNGIIGFNPDSIWTNQQIPPVVFTDFRLFDKSILFDGKQLPNHINETKEIILKYSQNSFTIGFSALNFIHSDKNVYSCLLQGFETEWNYIGSKNETKYTSLSPGTYFFKVKAANNSGVWNNQARVLKIIIRLPWWKTMLFQVLVIILFITLTIVIIRFRTLQLEHQKNKLQEKVKRRTLEIEKQKSELKYQAETLINTNSILVSKQREIEQQNEEILLQKNKLEEKNKILEKQKEQIIQQQKIAEVMSGQLHEADLKKIKFLTNISHEFRTPLSLIYSPLEKTLRELNNIGKDKLQERLKLMFRNTMRLLRLINEFLDISKIEAGLLKMNIGRGNIHNFIHGIIESYRYLSEQKNIHFRFISEMEHVTVFFDADKIEKILNNLLSNAFKYTPSEGEIIVRLIPGQKDENNEIEALQISVEDTGIGISDEFKNKIFERFYQIETNEEPNSGTGIGLALTQELILLYGGNVMLESEPGEGSRFIVSLPCSTKHFKGNDIIRDLSGSYHMSAENDYTNELMVSMPDNAEGRNFSDKRATLLLVEDNRDIVQFLQDQFSEDFNFLFALDGFKGFQKATSILPQAIILDIMMPKMNGYELCEKLKKDDRTCHIPIVFLTALAEKYEQIEGFEYGADDYITKPFDVDLLKAKVTNLIENRRKLKLVYQKNLTLESFGAIPESSDEKLIQKILKIAEKELSNPSFGVEGLSKQVGLSRNHLYRKILEITKQTPVEFIRNLRLAKASVLLSQNKFYVSEVAYMAGFTEISYFRKIFKDFYGATPSEYARRSKQ